MTDPLFRLLSRNLLTHERPCSRICIYIRIFVIVKMYCMSGQRLRHAVSLTLSIVFLIRFTIANNSAIFYAERSLLNRENANVIKILNISKSILRYNKIIQYKLINIYKKKNNYFQFWYA